MEEQILNFILRFFNINASDNVSGGYYMEFRVDWLDKSTLLKYLNEYELDNQVTIECDLEVEKDYKGIIPYMINENIVDIDLAIKRCTDFEKQWTYKKNKEYVYQEFADFKDILHRIKQKRYLGIQTTEVTYVYALYKHDERLKLMKSGEIEGFRDPNIDVLVGISNSIKIHLYKDRDDYNDFVLDVNYGDINLTHWHPWSIDDAVEDIGKLLNDLYVVTNRKRVFPKLMMLRPSLYDRDKKRLVKFQKSKFYQIIKF